LTNFRNRRASNPRVKKGIKGSTLRSENEWELASAKRVAIKRMAKSSWHVRTKLQIERRKKSPLPIPMGMTEERMARKRKKRQCVGSLDVRKKSITQ
jgi:hypothetical protein